MKLKISYLNSEEIDGEITQTWHNRWKSYESESMDGDMKISTVSHFVDRIVLDDVQITSKSSVDDLIEFLNNSKLSFKY